MGVQLDTTRSWSPSTTLSREQRIEKAKMVLRYSTSSQEALLAAKQLIGLYPHARPPDPETYAAGIAAVLAGYPLGLVRECVDPRTGLARSREFPPTPACIFEWCDRWLSLYRDLANLKPMAQKVAVEREYTEQHKQSMIKRLQVVMRDLLRHKVSKNEPS